MATGIEGCVCPASCLRIEAFSDGREVTCERCGRTRFRPGTGDRGAQLTLTGGVVAFEGLPEADETSEPEVEAEGEVEDLGPTVEEMRVADAECVRLDLAALAHEIAVDQELDQLRGENPEFAARLAEAREDAEHEDVDGTE